MKTKLTLAAICIGLCSCSSHEPIAKHRPQVGNSDAIEITIDNFAERNNLQEFNFDQYVDSVSFIKLNLDAPLGQISRLYFTPENIIVCDNQQQTIFVFDSKGNLQNTIKRLGRARNEYVSMSATAFDKQTSEIIIADMDSRKILRYNLQGEMTKVMELSGESDEKPIFFRDFALLDNGNYLCYYERPSEQSHNGCFEIDADGRFVKSYFENSVEYASSTTFSPFDVNDQGVFLRDMNFNDLYKYDDGQVETMVSYNILSSFENELIGKNITSVDKDRANIFAFQTHVLDGLIYSTWIDTKGGVSFRAFYDMDKEALSLTQWMSKSDDYIFLAPLMDNRSDVFVFAINKPIVEALATEQMLAKHPVLKTLTENDTYLEILHLKRRD